MPGISASRRQKVVAEQLLVIRTEGVQPEKMRTPIGRRKALHCVTDRGVSVRAACRQGDVTSNRAVPIAAAGEGSSIVEQLVATLHRACAIAAAALLPF